MPKTKQESIRKKTKNSGERLLPEIQILLEERSLLSVELQGLEARITQILVLGFGAIGGIASYLIQQQVSVPIFVWVLLPIALAVILAFGMIGIYNIQAHAFEMRLLTSKLHELIGDTDFPLGYDRNSPTSRFMSTRSGNPKVRIPYIIGLVGLAFVFLIVIILGYVKIYDYNHLLGNIYLTGCVIITTLLLLSFHGAYFDLPSYLDPIEKKEVKPRLLQHLNN